ncbi:MAG: hypothetical protein KGD61_01125 [Candidatus Lokiarchaeota archaeon]|nr:hypothetical protein [Candidatus Lokiarchaeota archaeon]
MKKKNSDPFIMLFVVVISLFLFTFIMLSIIPVKSGSGSAKISRFGIFAPEIEINTQVSGGNINIVELDKDSANLIETEWRISHTGLYLPQASIQVTRTIKGSRLIIDIISIVDHNDILSLSLNISFNPSYSSYSFITNTESGNVNINVFDINIKDFYFRTSSGKIDIRMNNTNIENNFEVFTDTGDIDITLDYVNFYNDFFCHSNSGVQLFDLWNLNFKSVADFNVSSDIGYIRIHWMNHYNKSQKVNINTYSNGDVKVKFWCPLEIMRGALSLFTVDGTTLFSRSTGSYDEISENHYQTPNMNNPSLDVYNITAVSTSGEAWVYYVNCFKWLRFCNWGMDFFPYNVDIFGNYSMLTQEHDISTINFFNTKYIYLNESRNLTFNFDTLPVSSEKLLYIEWDLDKIHAMGIGVGALNLKISHKRVSDTLQVYVELDFRLDQILPTFNDYNITVFYHPNYLFNQFLI